jgi:hypothetical protein
MNILAWLTLACFAQAQYRRIPMTRSTTAPVKYGGSQDVTEIENIKISPTEQATIIKQISRRSGKNYKKIVMRRFYQLLERNGLTRGLNGRLKPFMKRAVQRVIIIKIVKPKITAPKEPVVPKRYRRRRTSKKRVKKEVVQEDEENNDEEKEEKKKDDDEEEKEKPKEDEDDE